MSEVAKVEQREIQQVTVTPGQMLMTAIEQGADLDKLERLMDLQERWEQAEAKKLYTADMARFRAQCPLIKKTRDGHNTKYAGLAESIEQIKELMADCGLSHSWETEQDEANIRVRCTVTHIGGHSQSTALSAGADTTGSKNSIQAIGSTVSYLQRYTLFSILGLSATDMDDDGATSEDVGLAVDQLLACETVDELQAMFKAAYNTHKDTASRGRLVAAKDARKKELS